MKTQFTPFKVLSSGLTAFLLLFSYCLSQAQDSSVLPFDMPSYSVMQGSPKKVFARWHVYPISYDNEEASQDTWTLSNLNPASTFYTGSLHRGGMTRERPLPRAAHSGSKNAWMQKDMEIDIGHAMAAGIDGFMFNSQADNQDHDKLFSALRAASKFPGFKIALSPDATSAENLGSATYCGNLVNLVRLIKNNPDKSLFAALATQSFIDPDDGVRKDGVIIVPFQPHKLSASDWQNHLLIPLKNVGIPICFMGLYVNSTQATTRGFQNISKGAGLWNAAIYDYQTVHSASFASREAIRIHQTGQLWIHAIGTQTFRPWPGGGREEVWYSEANGSDTFQKGWKSALTLNAGITPGADWAFLGTWNDSGEGTGMRPGTAVQYSFCDLNAYYSTWFKFGKPTIKRDVLYYFHRLQPSSAIPGSTSFWRYSCMGSRPVDKIELTAFLTAPGILQIQIGSHTYRQSADAGLTTFRVPFSYGTPVFSLVRNGTTVKSVTSAYPILDPSTNKVKYQDFYYRGGSSSRPPVPMTDAYYENAFYPSTGKPTVTIQATDTVAAEAGANSGVFTVTRSGSTELPLTVGLNISGTAQASDYEPAIKGVRFSKGVSTVTITVRPKQDSLIEGAHTLTLALTSNPASYNVGTGASSATVTIQDDDVPTITSTAAKAGRVGSPLAYTIYSSPRADSFGATGLPAGLNINTSTGVISGTPTTGGTINVQLRATKYGMTGTKTLTMTISKANQSITFGALSAKAYGDTPFNLGATSSSGLRVSYSSSNPAVARVSGSTVTIVGAGSTTLTANQEGNAMYNAASPVRRTLNVSRKALAVNADARTKIYGSAIPTLTYRVIGLVNGDLAANVFTGNLSTSATPSSIAGTYWIARGTLTANSNYTMSYTGANLTVTRASLTIRANNKSRLINQANPAFDATYTGLVNGDLPANIGSTVRFACSATRTSPLGTYPIVPSGSATTGKYAITYQNGSLRVTQTAVAVKLDQTITFGALETVTHGNAPLAMTASASSSLPVSYASSNPSVATISGSTVTLKGPGTTILTASQAGNAQFNPAPNVTQTLTVQKPKALLVVAGPSLNSWDSSVKTRLESKGFEVFLGDDSTVSESDALDKKLILISDSCISQIIAEKFKNTPIPVLVWEARLLDDLGMTGSMESQDYGRSYRYTSATFADEDPLATGLTGNIPLFLEPVAMTSGTPSSNAIVVATINGSKLWTVCFAYENGAAMVSGNAPARRVSLPFLSTANSITAEGWKLFDAAVSWATQIRI